MKFTYAQLFLLLIMNCRALSQEVYQFPLIDGLRAVEDETISLKVEPNDSGGTGAFGLLNVAPSTCNSTSTTSAYFFEDMAGLSFSNNGFIDCAYSIQFTFRINELNIRNASILNYDWVQLLEFRNDRQDRGLYLIIDRATQGQATLNFWQLADDGGTSVRVGTPLFFNTTDLYQLTLVRNCSGTTRVFINGTPFGAPYLDSNSVYAPTSPTDVLYFFRDMPDEVYNEEASPGWVKNMVIASYEWSDEEISNRWDAFCKQLNDLQYKILNTCQNEETQFDIMNSTSSFDSLIWNFGDPASGNNNTSTEIDASHIFSNAGNYDITVTRYFRDVPTSTVFNITINPFPIIDLGPDLEINSGETATLDATSAFVFYEWQDGSKFSTYDAHKEGQYWVQVTDGNGCTSNDSVSLKFSEPLDLDDRSEVFDLFVPNTITPNGDGINDYWVIENIQLYEANRIRIYDRQGNFVHQLIDYSNNWQGTTSNEMLSNGVYFYFITDHGKLIHQGSLTILR